VVLRGLVEEVLLLYPSNLGGTSFAYDCVKHIPDHATQSFSLDPLAYVRTQTITFLFTLLKERPEQEHNLLRLLVNKLVRCTTPKKHVSQLN
jgi:hypothetical protein